MCGIVGLYNFAAQEDTLACMLRAVAHRGPDAEGIAEWQEHGARRPFGPSPAVNH